jgi:hypothetical protein
MLNETAAKEISLISLSNDTVKRRVDDISENVHSRLILRLKSTEMFALQLDESTDFTDKSHLLTFVRYEHEKYVIEDLLFCKEVIHNNATDVFEALNDFILKYELD